MTNDPINDAKKLMGALVRQPPKLHDEMKIRKSAARKKPKPKPDSVDGPSKGDITQSKDSR